MINQGKSITKQEKADLRLHLPKLLEEARLNEDTARAALRACLALRTEIPRSLLKAETIAMALTAREIADALDRLAFPETRYNAVDVLAALRTVGVKEIDGTVDVRVLVRLTKLVVRKLLKLSGANVSSRKDVKRGRQNESSQTSVTSDTVSAAINLALWIVSGVSRHRSRAKVNPHAVALEWVEAIHILWRSTPSIEGTISVMRFVHSLRSTLSAVDYAQLESISAWKDFVQNAKSSIKEQSSRALLAGRIRDLEKLLSVIDMGNENRALFFSGLQNICQEQPSDVPQEAVEWVARYINERTPEVSAPSASDKSQSIALDDMSVCLLSAWDAASESDKSKRVLENISRLAREMFQLDLFGTPGDVVRYDERHHELQSQGEIRPEKVEIARPAVRWSDGVRTRFLIRAVVCVTDRNSLS